MKKKLFKIIELLLLIVLFFKELLTVKDCFSWVSFIITILIMVVMVEKIKKI